MPFGIGVKASQNGHQLPYDDDSTACTHRTRAQKPVASQRRPPTWESISSRVSRASTWIRVGERWLSKCAGGSPELETNAKERGLLHAAPLVLWGVEAAPVGPTVHR